MEVEEKLTLEQKRCETVIKTRVAVLEEKYLKSKNKEAETAKKLKDALLQKESNEKEIKMLRDKARDQTTELQKINDTYKGKIKSIEDELKADKKRLEDTLSDNIRQLQATTEQMRTAQDNSTRLQRAIDILSDEKKALEDKVKRENQILTKQLNELKEQSERDLREKNENILRLNNILNENLEKQSAEQVIEMKTIRDQIDKKEREIALKNKELQDVTLILSKRDKEIATLKKEVEAAQASSE